MKKLLLFIFLVSALPVKAASFGNGDFSSDGALWNDASVSGTVSFAGGEAILETGDDVDSYSAVMVQGDDGFFSFADSIELAGDINWLLFDAKFEVLDTDNFETGTGLFTDALFVSLYDAQDFNLDLLLDPVIDSTLDGQGFLSYALNVSALQGRDIALSFELVDDDDGVNSRVTLDNVQFAASLSTGTVPEPSTLVLLFAGLVGVQRMNKQNRI